MTESLQPKVSIGLPVYNGEKYLRYSLDSILQQDFVNFELIISDNASTDGTSAMCHQYAAKDKRIRYSRNEANIGAAANFNRVFQLARCDYFKWASHDDVHLTGFLRRCVEVLDQAPPSVVLVAPGTDIIDKDGRKIERWHAERVDIRRPRPHQRVADLLRCLEGATALFGLCRTEALRKTRLIDRFHAADYVLLLELAILGEIRQVPEVLFQRRFHDGDSTNANKTQAELLRWFDPSQKPKGFLFPRMKLDLTPRTKLGFEYLRSIRRMPLPLKERLLCLFYFFLIFPSRESRRLGREYGGRFLHKLSAVSLKRQRVQIKTP